MGIRTSRKSRVRKIDSLLIDVNARVQGLAYRQGRSRSAGALDQAQVDLLGGSIMYIVETPNEILAINELDLAEVATLDCSGDAVYGNGALRELPRIQMSVFEELSQIVPLRPRRVSLA